MKLPPIELRATRPLRSLLFCALTTLVACGEAGSGSTTASNPAQQLFVGELCASCHGFKREGSWMGPPLVDLHQHWDRDSLAEFIQTPTKFTGKDERIRNLSKKFRTQMAPNKRLTAEQRLILADWLLAK